MENNWQANTIFSLHLPYFIISLLDSKNAHKSLTCLTRKIKLSFKPKTGLPLVLQEKSPEFAWYFQWNTAHFLLIFPDIAVTLN